MWAAGMPAIYVGFLVLRKMFRIVFEAQTIRTKLNAEYYKRNPWEEAKDIPPPSHNGFYWLVRSLTWSDEALFDYIGLDAVMFIRQMRTLIVLALVFFIYAVGVILPINSIGTNRQSAITDAEHTSGLAILTMANINSSDKSERNLLYVHAFGCVLTTLCILIAQYRNYAFFIKWSARFHKKCLPQNYSCYLKKVPSDHNHESLNDLLGTMFGKDHILSVQPIPYLPQLEDENKKFNEYLSKMEEDHKRPTTRAILDSPLPDLGMSSPKEIAKLGSKVTSKFKEVDALDYFQNSLVNSAKKIETLQSTALETAPQTASAFVTFTDALTAMKCVQTILVSPGVITPSRAPHPENVLWQNQHISSWQRSLRLLAIDVVLFFLIWIWMIPVGFAVSLFSIATLEQIPGGKDLVEALPASVLAILNGFLPSLVVIICFSILEPLLIFIVKLEGLLTNLEEKRTVLNLWFLFLVLNVFLVSTLANSILGALEQIKMLVDPMAVVDMLAKALPSQSAYFMNYILMGALSSSISLLRPQDIGLRFIKRLIAKTDRDLRAADYPAEFDYMCYYGQTTLVFTIMLTYTPIAPLIVPFAVFYYVSHNVMHTYNVIYVYRPSHDEGLLWGTTFDQIFVGTLVSQAILFGILSLNLFTGGMVIVAIILVLTAIAWYIMHQHFAQYSRVGSLHQVINMPPSLARIRADEQTLVVDAYKHPLLKPLHTQVITTVSYTPVGEAAASLLVPVSVINDVELGEGPSPSQHTPKQDQHKHKHKHKNKHSKDTPTSSSTSEESEALMSNQDDT
ncbi:early responsive to dehydration protein [Pelomyxa schiedti]|nr:early responsive to dehydration protein [Pelomyxa schiedti]